MRCQWDIGREIKEVFIEKIMIYLNLAWFEISTEIISRRLNFLEILFNFPCILKSQANFNLNFNRNDHSFEGEFFEFLLETFSSCDQSMTSTQKEHLAIFPFSLSFLHSIVTVFSRIRLLLVN
jgi:hypothetical protein